MADIPTDMYAQQGPPHLTFGQWLTDLLFPPACVGCGALLPPLDAAQSIFCPACAALAEAGLSDNGIVLNEIMGETEHSAHICLYTYRTGQTAGVPERLIYHIKHKDERRVFDHVGRDLGALVSRMWQVMSPAIDPASVVWTYPPRRASARRKDGFDQAERLAETLARLCGGECQPVIDRSGRRIKEQKNLDANARRDNIAHAYELPPEAVPYVKGHPVMLVDDVCTTGATLTACTELLMRAGASCVWWVTVAKTELTGQTESN